MLNAQTDWRKYGWQIFNNAGEGRSIALGNASVADLNLNSAIWNPSIISIYNSTQISYGHQSRFAGIIQSDFLSVPLTTKSNKPISLIVLHESIGKIPKTSGLLLDWGEDGIPNTSDAGENNGIIDDGERLKSENLSYFNQHQIGLQLNTLIEIFEYEVGISLRSLIQTLGGNLGSGLGLDIGIIHSFWKNNYIGLTIRNLMPALMIWDSGLVELSKPQLFFGISQKIDIEKLYLEIMFLGDLLINISNESLSDDFNVGSSGGNYRLGSEIKILETIIIRFGRNQHGYKSTGIGLEWNNFQINYAYQLNSNLSDLGSTHVLSFGIDPEWLKIILTRI
jgi:hypothetical protein